MSATRVVFNVVKVAVALALLVLIVMAMSGMFHDKVAPGTVEAAHRPVWQGRTVVVEAAESTIIEKAAGTIQASRRTAVSSKIMAQIKEMTVDAGAVVERGDVLVRLDDRDLRSRVEQARQRMQSAAATLQRAGTDYQRLKQLVDTGAISKSDFDAAAEAYRVAQATLAESQRALEEAEVSLSFAEITAPVSGRVVDRLAEPGDNATPGQPLLHLYDPSALRLEVPVRESLATELVVGASLDVHIDAVDLTLAGSVDEIVPQAEAGARAFTVKVVLPHHDRLYTGMFGRLLLPVGRYERLLVPAAAIAHIGQLHFADVLDAEGRPHRRMVTLGATSPDGRVEVLSGLRAGERVAVPTA